MRVTYKKAVLVFDILRIMYSIFSIVLCFPIIDEFNIWLMQKLLYRFNSCYLLSFYNIHKTWGEFM